MNNFIARRSAVPAVCAALTMSLFVSGTSVAQQPAAPPPDSVSTMYALLVGSPTPGTASSSTTVIVPGTVMLPESDLIRYSEDLSRLKDRLMSSYRLQTLESVASTAINMRVGQQESMPVPSAPLGVDVTLIAFDKSIATYQVRLTESGRVLAEPTVSIKVGSRAVIGTQDGQQAPYAFVVLSLPAPYVQAPLTWTPRQEAPAGGRAPRLIESVRPDYPPIAQAAHVAGTVIAECIVGTDGAPRDIRIMRSIPLLDQAAIEAVKMYRFEPARDASGNPVAFKILVSIRFEPRRD